MNPIIGKQEYRGPEREQKSLTSFPSLRTEEKASYRGGVKTR